LAIRLSGRAVPEHQYDTLSSERPRPVGCVPQLTAGESEGKAMAKSRTTPTVSAKSLELELEIQKSIDGLAVWAARLKGEPAHLAEVNHVIYVLPSTYANPVRTKNDRASRFLLEEEGSGTFTLYARAVRSDGKEVSLERKVDLSEVTETPRSG